MRWIRRTDFVGASDALDAIPALTPRGLRGACKWAVTGSNRRPPACKAGALPTELTARLTHCGSRPRGDLLDEMARRLVGARDCFGGTDLSGGGDGFET